jgi:hypothetical protein
MYIDFSQCNNKHEVLDKQSQYNVDMDSLVEFCLTELSLSEKQLEHLHEWHTDEQERLARLARQRLSKLGFTYRVKPEIL